MEGARWNVDKHYIDESNPRELFIQMAFFHLWPRVRKYTHTDLFIMSWHCFNFPFFSSIAFSYFFFSVFAKLIIFPVSFFRRRKTFLVSLGKVSYIQER